MVCARLTFLFAAFLATLAGVDARNSHRGGNNHVRRGVFAVDVPEHLRSCDQTVLSWNGTKAPYSLGLLVGSGSNAPLYHLGKTNSTKYNWEVDLAPNTTVTIAVKSATGMIVYSRKLVIEDGITTCLSNSSWTPTAQTYNTTSNSTADEMNPVGPLPNATASLPNATRITSGIGAAGASATSSPTSSASRLVAGLGLLISSAFLALVV